MIKTYGKIWLQTSTVINFITLKWGTKYGPEYVNRLYANLLNAYNGEFEFHCFTDDSKGLHPAIHVRDIALLRPTSSKCFTIEKVYLFDPKVISGKCVLFDLDILILKDLSTYLTFDEPRFIKNLWDDIVAGELLHKFGHCWINSSFVTWENDQLLFVKEFYQKNKEVIEFKYGDLDLFLFHGLRNKLNYHPENIVYSYVNNDPPYEYRPDHYIVLFNTSHGKGTELHEAGGWVDRLWKKFD
jgi:hypothetical protein